MTHYRFSRHLVPFLVAAAGLVFATISPAQQGGSPLKVFILAGQSNMEGHGEMAPAASQGTLEYLVANDPATYGHLQDGASWATRDDVWISYRRGGTTLLNGDLSAGYGVAADTIGPELQFGVELGDYLGEQVLLIKTAWGGKSLYTDFRPPSSGWSVNPPVAPGDQGYYYQQMLTDVNDVLTNLATYHPGYNAAGGYELAGFGWHQGWNDRVNGDAVAEYEANMKNFIDDVRNDLGMANLPFVIATTGIGGLDETGINALALMNAQLAMEDFTEYPAFDGNVAVVDTREFWREASESPANQGFHWNRNAETYFLIGQSMATHMRVLLDGGDTTPPSPDPMTWATPPTAAGEGEITMIATTATDIIGVEYFFECLTTGGNDSGWQDSPVYTDTGLANSTSYSYRVMARDESPDVNETGWSATLSATTTPADIIPPTPDPMTWAQVPTTVSSRVITMTASTASDPSGVEYYFTNTTVSGHDSGWQDSPEYTDFGLEPSTTYTYEVKARDKSVAGTENTPSAGTAATTLDPPPPGALIYEPFDDLDPTLAGNTAGTGLSGTWSSGDGAQVGGGSLSYGSLANSGGRVIGNPSTNRFPNGTISPGSTLSDASLMADGTTLWFSALIVNHADVPGSGTGDNRTYLSFGTGGPDGFDRIGGNSGSGFTVAVSKVNELGITAQAWNDGSDGTGGATRGATEPGTAGSTILAVGKITWGEFGVTDDVFELYLPGTNLLQPASPISTIAANFDQLGTTATVGTAADNLFDTIGFAGARGVNNVPELDEIRFGATYADVVPTAEDDIPPGPDPMTWVEVPAAVGENQITMTATTASDSNGVEYYFEETTGNPGGDDSGWQDSPVYVDTGLTPSTSYSYQVKARDKSPTANETGFSPLEFATTSATDTTAPTPNPMSWAEVPAPVSSNSIRMTAGIASDPSGVEYYFEETSGNPGGDDSGWQDSPEYIDGGLQPATEYTYTVRARDKSPTATETGASVPASAITLEASANLLIYEPFDDLDPTLQGNTPGTGLSGTWSSGDGTQVGSGSLSFGSLATSGGRVIGNLSTNRFPRGEISPGLTLSGAGLLNDGATLWFSALIVNAADIPGSETGDNRTYLSIGTGGPDGFDRIGGNSGSGFTVAVSKNAEFGVTAQGWNDNSAGTGGAGARGATEPVTPGATFLAVGKITWGAFNSDPSLATPDVFEIYLPGTDLALPDAPVSVVSKNYDQLGLFDTQGPGSAGDNLFDTIGFAGARGVNGVPELDEIRFGANYESVVPSGADDYGLWASAFLPGDAIGAAGDDYDGDGLTNDEERLFGLDPTSAASANPFSTGLDATTGTLSYTRRKPSLSGATFIYQWSTTLAGDDGWTDFTPVSETTDDGNPVETVTLTLDPSLLGNLKLFVRVVATDD